MDDMKENTIEWLTGQHTITLSLSQNKFIKKVEALCEKYPDKAKILAKLPIKALKLSIIKRDISDEKRIEMAEQAKKRFHGGK